MYKRLAYVIALIIPLALLNCAKKVSMMASITYIFLGVLISQRILLKGMC